MENMEIEEIVKDKKILLYGLGTETERVLDEWEGTHQIIGLLDSFRTTGEHFGYPIVDIRDAVKQKNVIIIVVARTGSCKAIAKKIGNLCQNNGVKLYDIRGHNLLQSNPVVYDFKKISGYKYSDVIEIIESVDAVSFDLFDTLVMRMVMSSTDVLTIVCARLLEKGIYIDNFVLRRLAAEKQLSHGRAPRLEEIYEEAFGNEQGIDLKELAAFEYTIDRELVIPRMAVIELLNEAKKMNKKVYITSDMYYSREQILEILVHCEIKNVDEVLISCEYQTGKEGELFRRLKETAGTDNIIHIGDNIVADIQSAKRHGLKTFQIYSGAEMFDMVGGLGLTNYMGNLSDQIRIGMFVSNIFNNPFLFEDDDRKLKAKDASDIGYLFCAPLVCDFVQWFGQETLKMRLKNIWFCARDGYLIKKIFEKYFPDRTSEYFLTSRIAAIRSGVKNIEDIAYIESMKFSGEVEDCLFTRFGLKAGEIDPIFIDKSKNGLLKYAGAILKAAETKRINNLKYIESLKMETSDIAFFDFVAKGTSQMFIERLTLKKVIGLYFYQLEPEFMNDKNLTIFSFWEKTANRSNAVYDNYYILETLLTSPEPSIEEFSEEGKPVYARETRTQRSIECLIRAQKGILNYTDRYLRICPKAEMRINKKLDEVFLSLIHNVEIQDKDFLTLTVEDSFFNRMTDIMDVF